jgi:hypothetical protein
MPSDGLDVDAQRFQALRGWRDRMGQRQDGGEHAFALDMDEQCPAVPFPTSVIAFAVPPQVTPEGTALGAVPYSHKPS